MYTETKTTVKRRRLAPLIIASVIAGIASGACRSPNAVSSTAMPEPARQAAAGTTVIDDFEGSAIRWTAGTWPFYTDSSASSVAVSSQHVTRGAQSLQLNFDRTIALKAIFVLESELDLSACDTLAFELFNDSGAASAVAIAFRSGDGHTWQESTPIQLKPGANAVYINLTGASFKSAVTHWQYQARPVGLDAVHQLALILYPLKSGQAFIDKLLATGPSTAPAPAVEAQDSTARLAIRAIPSEMAQYDKLELTIDTTLKVDNPFDPDQITIDVQLTSPAGEQIQVPAYYTQDFKADSREPVWPQLWRARFTPVAEGTWTARAQARSGQLIVQSNTVEFDVTPAVTRGFVRVNAANSRYLAFDNGEAFLPVGINLGWGHDDPLKDFERWFDHLKQNGANTTRIWMSSWAFGIEWNDSGLGRYRLDRAWLLDQVLRMAEERGIYVILVLINHGAFNKTINPEWDSNPYNAALGGPCEQPEDFATDTQARKFFKQRLRYMVARWSYSPNLLAWEWWNEVDLTPLAEPNLLRPWLQEMTAYLRSIDPHHHLTSISYADSSDPRVVNMPELDTMQRHDYSALDPRISMPRAYTELSTLDTQAQPKPILYTEYGASSYGEQPSKYDNEGMHFHNSLWASVFSGFASTAMYWWWDNYIESNDYWYHLKGISELVANEDVSTLHLTNTQVSTTTVQAAALGQDDRALLWVSNAQYSVEAAEWAYRQATLFGNVKEADWRFELQEQQNITVTLTGLQPGVYEVHWLDTQTGQWAAVTTVPSQGGRLTLAPPPFRRDIAAKVIRVRAQASGGSG
ncbi:MAG: DUF5060 domain-containing protein [Chloroflexi bacterium]|nr:DUF5060 domain-containing protein [Chloroflexota bacterium]